MHRQRVILIVPFLVAVAACSSGREDREEVAHQQQPIFSADRAPDTRFPAVGFLGGARSNACSPETPAPTCTVTLIGPQLALTAAHCVGNLVSCPPLFNGLFTGEALHNGRFVSFSPRGDLSDVVSYKVDGIVTHPNSYDTCDCSSRPVFNKGLRSAHDLALLHLAVDRDQPPPFAVVTPIPVLTSITVTEPMPFPAWHVALDRALNFDSIIPTAQLGRPQIVGWGASDDTRVLRRAGEPEFPFPLNLGSFESECIVELDCGGATVTNCAPGEPVVNVFRRPFGVAKGSYIGLGDSGGPLLVRGSGGEVDGVVELPRGRFFIMGVASGVGSAGGPVGNAQVAMFYAPTYPLDTNDDGNGPWLDARLRDFDGDGIDDRFDNCPTVPNGSRRNANFLAELALARAAGFTAPDEGHTPTSFDADDYVTHWHTWYPGDACDQDASASPSTFATTTPVVGSCGVVIVEPCTSEGCPVTPIGLPCPVGLSSGIQLDGYIANPVGDSFPAHSMSGPAFCACPTAQDRDPVQRLRCEARPFNCILAQDGLFPAPGQNPDPQAGNGWGNITQLKSVGGRFVNVPYAPAALVHQDDTDLTEAARVQLPPGVIDPSVPMFHPAPAKGVWNFPLDLVRFGGHTLDNGITGTIWGQPVGSIDLNLRCFACCFVDRQPLPGRRNSYLPTTVVNLRGRTIRWDPGSVGLHWGPIGWLPLDVGLPGEVPWITIAGSAAQPFAFEQTTSQVIDVTRHFSTAALGLLAGVAARTHEIIVGDDVVAAGRFQSAAPPALVVATGTTVIVGALRPAPSGGVESVGEECPTHHCTGVDPPDLRAYAAEAGKLFSLHADSRGATLTTLDVTGALAGNPVITTTALTGAVPTSPLAMAYHAGEGKLIVVDALAAHRHKRILRLLAIAPSGFVQERWRTIASASFPERVYVSTSAENEIVLALVGVPGRSKTEVALFDPVGRPTRSRDVKGKLLGAALGGRGGITLPFEQRPAGEKSNLRLALQPRSEMKLGLCGARWLARRASTGTMLTNALAACREEMGDGDDGDNENDDERDAPPGN